MNLSTLTRYFISLGLLFAIYVCYALVMMNDRLLTWWNRSTANRPERTDGNGFANVGKAGIRPELVGLQ